MPDFETAFRQSIREHLVTNRDKIRAVWARLDEAHVWHRANDGSLAPANQLIHLGGNLRQYVLAALAGQVDVRTRQAEFDARGGIGKDRLLADFEGVLAEVLRVLEQPVDPTRRLRIQGQDFDPVAVWVHVTEHLSYHTGQLVAFAKALDGRPFDFYADWALDATGHEDHGGDTKRTKEGGRVAP